MNSASLTNSTKIVAAESTLSTTINGETVILHTDVGKYYGLNDVGTFIWKLISEPRTVEELCEEVVNEYDVGYQRCNTDIKKMVSEMNKKGIVELDAP